MNTNNRLSDKNDFLNFRQLEIEIYFKEFNDSCANDCRRFLHIGRNGTPRFIELLQNKLGDRRDTFTIFPKDYALLRHVPHSIEIEREIDSKRRGSGKSRGGLEIYDIFGLDDEIIQNIKEVLDEEKGKHVWFNHYKIYLREELL